MDDVYIIAQRSPVDPCCLVISGIFHRFSKWGCIHIETIGPKLGATTVFAVFFWCFCKWGSMNYSPTWLRCRWGWSSLPLPCCWLRLPWPRPLNGAVGNARTTNGLCLVVQVCLSNQNGYIVIWRCIAYNDVLPPNKSPTSGPQKILNSPGCRGLLLWKGNQTCLLVKSQKSCCSKPTFSRGREGHLSLNWALCSLTCRFSFQVFKFPPWT